MNPFTKTANMTLNTYNVTQYALNGYDILHGGILLSFAEAEGRRILGESLEKPPLGTRPRSVKVDRVIRLDYLSPGQLGDVLMAKAVLKTSCFRYTDMIVSVSALRENVTIPLAQGIIRYQVDD